MCNFGYWHIEKETSGIKISRPFWGPATLVCWECSLSSEKYQYPPPDDAWPKSIKDEEGTEYIPLKGCYCTGGDNYISMARHVIEHITSREKIHPSVLIILEELYNNHRLRLESDWFSRVQNHLMKLANIDWKTLNANSLKPSYYTEYKTFPRLK